MDRARQPDLFAPKTATSRRGKRAKATARQVPNTSRLSVVLTGDEPPNEFCLFTAGKVVTTKGEFVFDEDAAKAVMAEYVAHGIDLMIDYDHASLAGVSLDPAESGKAAGWFNLEVRAGELWAVNVRWTEPAAEALRAKEWRFMSPAFCTEGDRITSVMNVAITNLPATRRLEPLMAASVVTALGENAMTLEEFMKVCKALGLDMTMSLDDAMAKIKGEAPADPDATTEDAPPPAGDGGADEATEAAAAAAPPAKEDKPAEVAAALSALCALSGKPFVASIADVRTWHASHVKLEEETQKLAAREAVLESAERRKLCVELVSLGGRKPSMVWADDSAKTPKAYLMSMPIADLRAMHADEIKAGGGRPVAALKAPVSAALVSVSVPGGGVVELTAAQAKICKDTGCDPAVFATLTAQRDSVKTTGGN